MSDTKTPLTGSWKKHVDFNYLAGEDLMDDVLTLTIKEVVKESAFNTRAKKNKDVAVLRFNEVSKGIILNLTNSRTITRILKTDKVDDWVGKKINFYGQPDKVHGRVVRVKEDYSQIKV